MRLTSEVLSGLEFSQPNFGLKEIITALILSVKNVGKNLYSVLVLEERDP